MTTPKHKASAMRLSLHKNKRKISSLQLRTLKLNVIFTENINDKTRVGESKEDTSDKLYNYDMDDQTIEISMIGKPFSHIL